MSLRAALLARAAPRFVTVRLLDELARATATGFGSAPPAWISASLETRLEEYARYTADLAERALAADDPRAVEAARRRLHQEAARLGARVRRGLGLRSHADAVDTLATLYKHLGIDMSAGPAGEVVVRRCLFAGYFSEVVCGVVAALDEGMADGLSGGGRLEFIERITGGAPCCRARFDSGRTVS